MTLREAINNTKKWFVDSYNDITSWFSEGFGNLVQGNFLELTIGQALLIIILVSMVIIGIRDEIRDFIKGNKSSDDDDSKY